MSEMDWSEGIIGGFGASPSNEVDYLAAEEQAEAGRAMEAELREYFGEPEGDLVKTCSRCLYEVTACGAWLALDGEGLRIGSIVEGAYACTPVHLLTWGEYLGMDEGGLAKWLDANIEEVEAEAQEIWNETHGCEECGEEGGPVDPNCKGCGGDGIVL